MKYALLLAVIYLLSPAMANASTYQVITEEWPPYNYEEEGKLTGISTDIVRAIMALTGDDFDITQVPSMRASRMLDTQPKTIMFSMVRTPTRESKYKWVGPLAEFSIHPYELATAPHPINTLAQLRNAPRVTTRHDGLIPNHLQSLGFTNLDRSAGQSQQLYLMLKAGRTDVIVGDPDAGVLHYSRVLGIPATALRRIPVTLYRGALYIVFSADSDDERVAAWSKALEQLRASGEIERIQMRYETP